MMFSYEWGDPANQVEFASASRRAVRVDEQQQAMVLFTEPVRQSPPRRREMRIGMRVWDREVVRG